MMLRYIALCVLCGFMAWARPVAAQEAQPDSLAELMRRLNILAEEIERLRLGEAAASADESQYGFGPAASKIYRAERGVSIGGYGEMVYNNFAKDRDDGVAAGKTDQFDFLRAIVYVGYKFNEKWLFNSEIEFEHASTGKAGEVSVEFAYVDYLYRPEFGLRFGVLLLPMGLINELHEPTVFMGVGRPDIERVIIPTTWRENGAGVFGNAGILSYRSYIVNGLKGSGFSSGGLRGGRQSGSKAQANHFAWTGRLDVTPRPGILFGGSVYAGFSAQNLTLNNQELNVSTRIYEGHADIRYQGVWFSLLGARADVGDVAELNQVSGFTGNASVGETLQGYYVQAGYDLLTRTPYSAQSLMPYLRYESFNTQDAVPAGFSKNPANDVQSLTVGLAYYPESRVVFKLDYKNVDNDADTGVNQFNAAVGYIF